MVKWTHTGFETYFLTQNEISFLSKWPHWNNNEFQTYMGIKGALTSKTIFGNLKPFQNDEKCFLFHLKSFFLSEDI